MSCRNRNHEVNPGNFFDVFGVRFCELDPRNTACKSAHVTNEGRSFTVRQLKQPVFLKANAADVHIDDAFFPQHQDAMSRISGEEVFAKVTCWFPTGVTCRVAPFSVTDDVLFDGGDTAEMVFDGEIPDPATGEAPQHQAQWTDFWFSVENKDQQKKKVGNTRVDEIAGRFGKFNPFWFVCWSVH